MNIQGVASTGMARQEVNTRQVTSHASSSTNSSSTGLLNGSSSNMQDTFLSLLATELQNQDPTSPVDPTQMVGQMVSLNQLDQLISINQTLTSMASRGATTSSAGTVNGAGANAQPASGVASSTSASHGKSPSGASSANAQVQTPTYPIAGNPMQNLYGAGTGSASSMTFATSGGR